MSDEWDAPEGPRRPAGDAHPDLDEFRERIWHLATFQDGWYGGAGSAPPLDGLAWLGDDLAARTAGRIPLPRLYPTAGGSIRCEWLLGRWDASMEVDLRARRGDLHVLDVDAGRSEVALIALDQVLLDRTGWDRVVGQLQALRGTRP